MSDALAELFADLGIKIDERSWNRAEARLQRLEAQARQQAERASNSAGRAITSLLREQERASTREARNRSVATARQQSAAQRATDRELTRQARVSSTIQQRRQQAAARQQAEARHQQRQHQQEALQHSAAATGMIQGITQAVAELALSIGSQLVSSAGEALISFNANMEDAKNHIAGMLALTKQTHLSDELKTADTLVANLQVRAAKLPGTTAEYVSMLNDIVRPITDAKMSMQDLEDITVNSVVAAKAMGIPMEEAARDMERAFSGIYHNRDRFNRAVLGSIGYKGQEGEARYNQLSEAKRASEFKRAILQSQFTELGAAQGKSFRGLLSTIEDTISITAGRIGKPLFGEMSKGFEELIGWINKNQDAIDKFADKLGGGLVEAFHVVKGLATELYNVFAKHPEALKRIADVLGTTLGSTLKLLHGLFEALVEQLDAFLGFLETDTGKSILEFLKVSSIVTELVGALDAMGVSIKDFFKVILTSPTLMILIKLVEALEDFADRFTDKSGAPENGVLDNSSNAILNAVNAVPSATPTTSGGGGVTIGQVSVGDIHVTTPSTDPGAVAKEARKVFGEELKGHLRKTLDQVS